MHKQFISKIAVAQGLTVAKDLSVQIDKDCSVQIISNTKMPV